MWRSFGRTIAESFIIDKIAAEEGRVTCATPSAIVKRQGGAIFVGLHFGNWEATVVPAAQLGEKPIGIYKPLRSASADAYLRKLRANLYPGGLLPASQATLLKVVRHLRDGGSVCMLADHRDLNGTVVPFFGYSAPSATLPALIGVKYGLPIYAARVDRLDGVRFSVHIEQVTAPSTHDQAADVVSVTAAIQATFERWITESPDQWVWFYNRWDSVPTAGPTV
jgi:KDO2-lipid IV(A) lauroyltransferase